jgi:tellurium resistance protein TerZ
VIELDPGQELALTTEEGSPLVRIRMGVGWDKERTAGFMGTGAPDVDLDAFALEFAGDQLLDLAFYNNRRTRDGSVEHLGDNLTGRGEGDDEVVTIDLSAVHPRVDAIVLAVASYQGHSLEWISGAYCRLVDEDDRELARLTLTLGVPETGVAMARLVRAGTGWRLRAIGEGIAVTRATDAVDALRPFL